MTLTPEQLSELKDKILADKCLPIKAIRELYPNEDLSNIRTQLFSVYPRDTLLNIQNNNKELRIEQLNARLVEIENQKTRILAKIQELQ